MYQIKRRHFIIQEKIIENGIEYVKVEDYYFPNLSAHNNKEYNIGKYGRLYAKFIKENRSCLYTAKMIDGTWYEYLKEIDNTAKESVNRLIKELANKQDITETLKATD